MTNTEYEPKHYGMTTPIGDNGAEISMARCDMTLQNWGECPGCFPTVYARKFAKHAARELSTLSPYRLPGV